jgi:hypothetical protein
MLYAATRVELFEFFETSLCGERAEAAEAETHREMCSSNSYRARSISTFFRAASLVLT